MVVKFNWFLTLPSIFLTMCFVHDEPRASQLKMKITSMNQLFLLVPKTTGKNKN